MHYFTQPVPFWILLGCLIIALFGGLIAIRITHDGAEKEGYIRGWYDAEDAAEISSYKDGPDDLSLITTQEWLSGIQTMEGTTMTTGHDSLPEPRDHRAIEAPDTKLRVPGYYGKHNVAMGTPASVTASIDEWLRNDRGLPEGTRRATPHQVTAASAEFDQAAWFRMMSRRILTWGTIARYEISQWRKDITGSDDE